MNSGVHLRPQRVVAACLIALFVTMSPATARAAGVIDLITDGVASAWSFISGVVSGAAETAGDVVTPPTPIDTLRMIKGQDKSEFWSMLEDAGYDLKEIETEIGLIPGIKAKYILKRELSDSDREALERRLETHTETSGGLVARLERAIIYALLDASELGEYRIQELEVKFLPLPAASFVLAPAEAPLEEEHDRIFRAVKEQTRAVRHIDREGHRRALSPPANAVSTR